MIESKLTRRPAQPSDKETCRRIHHAAYHDVVSRQFGTWDEAVQDGYFEQAWNDCKPELLEVEGRAVGVFGWIQRPDHLFIHEVQIVPEYQSKGLGTLVLKEALARAKELGLPVSLQVLHENRARSLYEKLGFQVTGKTETHFVMVWRP